VLDLGQVQIPPRLLVEAPHGCTPQFRASSGGRVCPTRPIALNPQRCCAGGGAMDNHDQLEYATARGNDYAGHEQMYHTFVTLTRSAVAVIAVILILMAIFLT